MARDQVLELFTHGAAPHFGAVTVHHHRQRVHGFVVHQNLHFDQIVLTVANHLVIERGIALGHRFQTVVEVEHDLVQRQVVNNHGTGAGIGQVQLDAATILTEFQHVPQIFVGHHDGRLDPRFFNMVHMCQIGHVCGVVQLFHRAVFHVQVINHRRRRGDQVQIIFTLQTITDHLEVQKPQEPAAEAKAQRSRGFHFRRERRVIQLQFLNGVAQVFEVVGIHGEQSTEHNGNRGFETRQRRGAGLLLVGNGITDLGVAHLFDRRGKDADLARTQFGEINHLGFQHGQLVDLVAGASAHHLDLVALLDRTVDHADQNDNAQICIIPTINQHRLERGITVPLGRGKTVHDRFQNIRNTQTAFGRDRDRVLGVNTDHVLDVFLDPIRVGGRQVNLVQNRHDFMIGLDRLIDVG